MKGRGIFRQFPTIMKKLLLILILGTGLLSCSKEKQEGNVLIRIKNETTVPVEDAKLYSWNTINNGQTIERSYGSIPAGQTSGYQPHQVVMSYGPFYQLYVPGYGEFKYDMMRCPVGATPIAPGNYSLVISNDGAGNLSTSLRPD